MNTPTLRGPRHNENPEYLALLAATYDRPVPCSRFSVVGWGTLLDDLKERGFITIYKDNWEYALTDLGREAYQKFHSEMRSEREKKRLVYIEKCDKEYAAKPCSCHAGPKAECPDRHRCIGRCGRWTYPAETSSPGYCWTCLSEMEND